MIFPIHTHLYAYTLWLLLGICKFQHHYCALLLNEIRVNTNTIINMVVTGDLITENTTEWLTGKEHIQHEYAGRRDDSRLGQERAGRSEISAHH